MGPRGPGGPPGKNGDDVSDSLIICPSLGGTSHDACLTLTHADLFHRVRLASPVAPVSVELLDLR